MAEEHFGFSGPPFKLSPDSKFFFGSKSHNKAMAYLHYGLRQAEGFIVITGEIGAGKSMLIEYMLEQLDRTNVIAANLVTSNLRAKDLLSHVLSAFNIEASGAGRNAELEAFEDYLFDNVNRGRRVLLIVDEAQNLPADTIEELRMLTNISHQGTPLFQVFLVGQPEFRDTLAIDTMEQLRQRVIASYHLDALSPVEVREYIEYRMSVVGWKNNPLFTEEAFAMIAEKTDGVPRRINTLCTRILLFCALERRELINSTIVATVAQELRDEMQLKPEPLKTIDEKSEDQSSPDQIVVPFTGVNVVTPESNDGGYSAHGDEESYVNDDRPKSSDNGYDLGDDAKNVAHDDLSETENQNVATLKDVAAAIAQLAQEKQHRQQLPSTGAATEKKQENSDPVGEKLQPIQAPIEPNEVKKDQSEASSVFDQIHSMRKDLRSAHMSNREVQDAMISFEDSRSNNVVKMKDHLSHAQKIIKQLQSKS